MDAVKLDKLDRRILQALQRDGRIQNASLAQQVGLSPSSCLRRVRQLEEAGVISRYVAVLDGSKPVRGGIPICWPWFGPAPARVGSGKPSRPGNQS